MKVKALTAVEAVRDNGEAFVQGMAVPYNSPGVFFGQKISVAPLAAVESLERKASSETRDILMLASHDDAKVLARVSNMTLDFIDSPEGLLYWGVLNLEDPDGKSAYEKVKRGEYNAASIGFSISDSEMVDDVLVANEIELYEVSLVAQGVYEKATSELVGSFNLEVTYESEDDEESSSHELGVAIEATKKPNALQASEEIVSQEEPQGKLMSVVRAELQEHGIL